MKKKITIKDVALETGMSTATVSLILNGKGHKFSQSTVKKVLKATEELGYQADYFAQQLVTKQSKTIAVIIPDIKNPFFSALIQGIEQVLCRENYMTLLSIPDINNDGEYQYLTELQRRGVDGYIIASALITDKNVQAELAERREPCIVLDQNSISKTSDVIATDDVLGGKLAATHLQDLGHKFVAVVLPQNASENIQRRLEGFLSVYEEKNVNIIYETLSKEGGKRAVKQLLLLQQVTAIFAINDEIAFGLYRGLRDCGKDIPGDYSIIGYDNVDMAEYVYPQLTTVEQSVQTLGEKTAETLLDRISHPDRHWRHITLPVQLIIRNSTAHLK